ncbi:CMP-N-acetylneuraminate-beta-galactosamide-alpha-2,3-sialyltransferase 1-like [Ochotona princeps]|uniref:CMP-N-acetylneuraminate-beta-galactosamide- alpha-2,3-sialyltransferase 1-like n=1 Tax=Ochotona princeps TaxID=9978 RepID=UPI00064BCF23|nr:CMP-N-acetylneuraminate-beta-galactosamide-alpha-2,3-sialyltransferase 1-like [Ochotona princeps]
MNQAPVQGFEMDVGNRTSIRIMYPETARAQEPGTQLLLLPLNSSGLKWFIKTLHLQHSVRKPQNPGFQIVHFPSGTTEKKDQVLVISLSFLKYIQERWLAQQGIHPSLGFVALLYALHTCDQVSLFGFGEDHLQRWSHYWDNSYWFEKSAYFPAESQVIRQLQCNKKIRNYS